MIAREVRNEVAAKCGLKSCLDFKIFVEKDSISKVTINEIN